YVVSADQVEGARILARRFLVREERECAVAGLAPVFQPSLEVACRDRVVRELGEVGALRLLERLDDLPVQLNTAGIQQPVVQRVADQDVREAKPRRVARD